MSESFHYLGEFERRYQADATRGLLAIVRPLYRVDHTIASWHDIEDAAIEFRVRGRDKWFEPHAEACEGTLWQFRTTSNYRSARKPGT
jgi:hypothetical protein